MDNPLQQLLDMAAVHGFYVSLLQEKLGFDVPVPYDIQGAVGGKDKIIQSVDQLSRWLALLDMAIAPVMIRDGLKDGTRKESAEALLRYFYQKHSSDESDRDKADFTITFLFRNLKLPLRSADEWSEESPSPFEQEIYTILGLQGVPPLPDQHRQLVREFPFIRQEVEDIRHFDKLMDSGVMQRVRDIKLRFGASFYHPRVLATMAEYNVFIGNHFDELFREATRSIKQFASSVQQAGGSIMARVEGDVTVKQLSEVQEEEILEKEYGRAQEQLRKVSKFKKAVDSRRIGTAGSAGAAAASPLAQRPHPATQAATAPRQTVGGGSAADIGRSLDRTVEEGKLRSMVESIRNFVLAADAKAANVYPMRNGNLPLSTTEVEAFRAEFRGEKSFRGDYAQAIANSVAVYARMLLELEEFRQRQHSAYLWKPHADALAYLLQYANRMQEECAAILHVAEARGLVEKVNGMNSTLQRLRAQCLVIAKALEEIAATK
ncbi:MAG TPA: hypothetical protein VN577_24210 [Terriglobales bacterium]|nr:hypothetical protein [Terriglobales bacterium]